MPSNDFLQLVVYIFFLIVLAPPLGILMARVFEGRRTFLTPYLGWLEMLVYRLAGVREKVEMDWRQYLKALLVFNVFGFLIVFLLQIFQNYLPLNPAKLPGVRWDLAFNTAVSFMTNTNWQAYSGEVTLSYLTQMLGLTVQNFLSAATGIGVLLVLIRGIRAISENTLGNFWVDVTRALVYILIPLAIIVSLILVCQGVIQNFSAYREIKTLTGASQTLPMGPVASQIAIKQLGTNGGGYFGANSAHPFENPTPLSNFVEMLAILLIPAGLVFTFGEMIGNRKHAWLIFLVMFLLWSFGLGVSLYSEYSFNRLPNLTVSEGQETRFGIVNSVIWSTATTSASNGSVNAMISSLTPLAGGISLFNIMLGEIVFGGVGSGLYGMLLFVIMTVFLAGLMVGRTPEYLGKKIEKEEIQMAIIGILISSALILFGAGISCYLPAALKSLSCKGPHSFSEILYAFSSGAGNNGSAFAGLNANTVYYNLLLGLAMLIGRFGVIIPCLVIAGTLVKKKITPASAGTFTTDNYVFAILLLGTIIIVGVLTFFPALALGPLVEHLLKLKGRLF